jgi:hypothetical protein
MRRTCRCASQCVFAAQPLRLVNREPLPNAPSRRAPPALAAAASPPGREPLTGRASAAFAPVGCANSVLCPDLAHLQGDRVYEPYGLRPMLTRSMPWRTCCSGSASARPGTSRRALSGAGSRSHRRSQTVVRATGIRTPATGSAAGLRPGDVLLVQLDGQRTCGEPCLEMAELRLAVGGAGGQGDAPLRRRAAGPSGSPPEELQAPADAVPRAEA